METIKRILSQMSNISKPRQKFLLILFPTIMILRGRMNYRNMSRYSGRHEKSFSRNFRKSFDFTLFNHLLISETILKANRKIAAVDASYVPKTENTVMGSTTSGVALQAVPKKDRKYHPLQLLIWTITPHTIFLLNKRLPAGKLAKKRKIESIFTFNKFNGTKITCVTIISLILPLMGFTAKLASSMVLSGWVFIKLAV